MIITDRDALIERAWLQIEIMREQLDQGTSKENLKKEREQIQKEREQINNEFIQRAKDRLRRINF